MPVGVVTTQPDRSPMFRDHAVGDERVRVEPHWRESASD